MGKYFLLNPRINGGPPLGKELNASASHRPPVAVRAFFVSVVSSLR